jgi:hypothetical protein
MEKHEQQPSPAAPLEDALLRLPYDKMLQFTADGFNLLGYEATGETDMRTIKFQGLDIVNRFQIYRPVVDAQASNLEELLPSPQEDTDYRRDDRVYRGIDEVEFKEWKESMISSEDIKETCRTQLKRREIEGNELIVDCVNCEGSPNHTGDCQCTGGGIIFTDSTGESEDEPVSLREEGEVDPDCNTCEGQGEVTNSCLYCEGCGQSAKYPAINLVNAETGEERSISLDLATLVASGDVEVIVSQSDRDYGGGLKVARQSLVFCVSDYIDKCIDSIGIDRDNFVVIRGTNVFGISTWRDNTHVGESSWRQEDSKIDSSHGGSKAETTPKALLDKAQSSLSRSHNWQKTMIKNEDGVGVEEEWIMRPLRPFQESLEDLRVALSSQDYNLGYLVHSEGIDAGCPRFYALNQDGSTARILSDGWKGKVSIRVSLENAWLEFQRIQAEEASN